MASGQDNYRKGLRNSVYGLWAGVLDKSDFHNAMSSTIERWLTVAWNEGAAECGIGPEDLTIEEHRALLNAIDSELGHLSGYADYIVQNSKANGGKRATAFKRLENWVRRYKDLTNRAKTMACKDKRLEWRLGATEEHCRVCNKLHGKVKRASYWEAAGLHPQDPPNDRLDCGGWNCLCTLRVTDKPVSKGPLPGGRGPVAQPIVKPERPVSVVDTSIETVNDYLDVTLSQEDIEVLSSADFDARFGSPDDTIHGGIAAIRTPDGKIYLRKGYESDATHELIHAAGALEEGVGTFLNEGIAQTAAETIGELSGLSVRETYGREVEFVRRYILPTVGVPEQEFNRGYVRAKDKGQYVVDLIWDAHGSEFSDVDEWGSNPKASLQRDIPYTRAFNPHLGYLVDELGIGQ